MEKIKIDTTQNVAIEFPVASIGERILAAIIDYVVLTAFAFAILAYLGPFIVIATGSEYIRTVILVIVITVLSLYHLVFELMMNGQTFGKLAMRIKVIKIDGAKPTFGSYFLRWVLRIVEEWLTFGALSIVSILVNGRGQRLGDIAASTVVVKVQDSVKLEDTIFSAVEDNYTPVFPEVTNLTEKDISILNELILANTEKNISDNVLRGNFKAKRLLEEKLNVDTNMTPLDFFHTLIKDYNSIHGKLA